MTLLNLISALHSIKGTGGWKKLAQDSGVDYFTIARIARGEIKSPGVLTCEKLEAALPKSAAEETEQAS